jgi:hypothetical protein
VRLQLRRTLGAASLAAISMVTVGTARAQAPPGSATTPAAEAAPGGAAPAAPPPDAPPPAAPPAPSSAAAPPAAAPPDANPAAPSPAPVEAPALPSAPPAAETAATTDGDNPKAADTSAIDVKASTSLAGYADSDHVYVVSPTVAGSLANPIAGWNVDARYLLDVVSAASVDIVSTASRRWIESRHVGSLGGLYKPGEFGVGANADVSIEPDYQSYTFGGSLQQDLLNKNLTVLLGYEHGHDIAGRGNTPFSVFSRKIDHNAFKGGVTLVLDKATLFSAVGDVILESGDTSKPYRYVPMFAPGVDVPRGASVGLVNQLRLPARVLEQLPTQRGRYALAGHLAHRFAHSTLRLEERLYTDSWGLNASSTDARFIFDLGERVDLGPHLRFHVQSPVVFWQRAYVMGQNFDYPALRTGDRELGPLMNFTGGASLRIAVGSSQHPRSWVLGLDANVTETRYLDDIYITSRLAGVSALSVEAEF